ncbi:MAG TPA: hypothetical protein VFX89_11100 [Gammaproteobacteria bacterium]|nr:hypothetical protein [Gammaproteobacteria bacterium]
MTDRKQGLDHLEQVQELNGLFLAFLQSSVRDGLDSMGLPERAHSVLLATHPQALDALANFPRALFRLAFDEHAPPHAVDPLRSRYDSERYSLSLTILLCAWTLSKQSVYQARLLLGLGSLAMQQLRAMQLGEIQRLAHAPHLVLCAFPDRPWFWPQLLAETRPEGRQQLALIALQPGLDKDWPARRTSAELSL